MAGGTWELDTAASKGIAFNDTLVFHKRLTK
jgi:hypothetical protein